MKIVLIGATGFVGSHLLTELINRGHQITAIVRDPSKITTESAAVLAVEGDVFDTAKLAEQIKGHNAVISAYNPGWTNPEIYTQFLQGSKSIQAAARQAGVKRYITVGGAGSLEIAPGVQLIDTPNFPAAFKPGAGAARDYLNILKTENELDWTFVSPAIEMSPETAGVRKGTYRTALDNPVFDENKRSIISVEDLAVAIVDELEQGKFIKKRFTAAY